MQEQGLYTESKTVSNEGLVMAPLSRKLAGYGKTVVVTVAVALLLKTCVVEAYRIPTSSMENTLLAGDFLLVNKFAYGLRSPRYVPLTSLALPSFSLGSSGRVKRGDVVVFEYPGDRDEPRTSELTYYIKRCIGLAGDKVEIRRGEVFVNGRPMRMPQDAITSNSGFPKDNQKLYPEGREYTDYNYGPIHVPRRGERIELTPGQFEEWKPMIMKEGHEVQLEKNGDVFIDGRRNSDYEVERNYYFVMGDNRDNSMDSRYWGFVPEENLVGEALMVYWSWEQSAPLNSLGEKLGSIRWERIGKIIR